MNRLVKFFEGKNEKALICYFPVGDPTFDSLHIARQYLKAGANVLEIGLPSKNPYLDGEIVANSMIRALKDKGVEECFKIIVDIRKENPEAILQVMCYKDLFEELSIDKINDLAKQSELDGMLVADASLEELKEIRQNLLSSVSLLNFIPFDCSDEQLNKISNQCEGYAFLQAVSGVTGARKELEPDLQGKIDRAKRVMAPTPVCVGFGVSNEEHCKQISNMGADGIIIGSATLKMISEGDDALFEFINACKSNM